MSDLLKIVMPYAAILGGLYLAFKVLIPNYEEGNIEDEASKIGVGVVEAYGHCVRDSNCMGGTNIGGIGNSTKCQNGKCIPLVRQDTTGKPMYLPDELGLPTILDRFYLMGRDMGRCNRTEQCSADGIIKEVSQRDALSSSPSSKYYCDPIEGRCRAKCKDNIGIWWEKKDAPFYCNYPDSQTIENAKIIHPLAFNKDMTIRDAKAIEMYKYLNS